MTLHHSHVLDWSLRTIKSLEKVGNHMTALENVMYVIDQVALGECDEDDFIEAFNQYRSDIADREV